ncbi:MAG: energy-coupling factor ABC transporter permease [Phycisphaerae bacterium]|nr:energy-coupling factor ABC transporter permease [Phycisphaerae bacterium]
MHMANELLSVPVAAGTFAAAGIGLGVVCNRVKQTISTDQLGLMGILGAFVFAAQMINLPLPGLPGTSGHLIGAVLLAILLGPHAGALVVSSIVMVQCLLFQDGGLLALGCNIINMALVPSYLGFALYRLILHQTHDTWRFNLAVMASALITVLAGAILVPMQTALSGVLTLPFSTFAWTMLSVHLVIGLMEGIITVAVLAYVRQIRPDILSHTSESSTAGRGKLLLVTLGMVTLFLSAFVSLYASDRPDGLEWSYAQRPDQPAFESMVQAHEQAKALDTLQSKYTLLPDYARRPVPMGHINTEDATVSAGWTSFAGVVGSLVTMAAVWGTALLIRKKTPNL